MALFLIWIGFQSIVQGIYQETNDTLSAPTESNAIPDEVLTTSSSFDTLIHYFKSYPSDTLKIFGLFISWNVISQQFAKIAKMVSPANINHKRLSESLWRLVYHITVGLYTGNLILTYCADSLVHPFLAWTGHVNNHKAVPEEFVFLHFVEISFYLYVVSDLMRSRDRLRHGLLNGFQCVILLILIELVYNFHYYEVGLLLFLLHDATGFVLEFTKGMIYLENVSKLYKYAAYCNFGIYVGLCLYVTSYWFPRKIAFYATYLAMTTEDRPMIELIAIVTILVEIVNIYWCLILVKWTKQVIYSNPYSENSMLYKFLHKVVVKSSKANGVQAAKMVPVRRSVLQSRDAKALIQTVRCVMVMKRKLKRIRERKNLQPQEDQLLQKKVAVNNDDFVIETIDVWHNASAGQLSVATQFTNYTEIESSPTSELAHMIADQVTDEAAREEGVDLYDRSSAVDDLLTYDSLEHLTTEADFSGFQCGSLCESDDSMQVLYDVNSCTANVTPPCVVGDNASLYVDPNIEVKAQGSSKDIYESKKKSTTSEKGDVQL